MRPSFTNALAGAVIAAALLGQAGPLCAANVVAAPAVVTPASAPAAAPTSSPTPPDPAAVLATAQQTLAQLQNQLQTTSNDARLAAMAAQAAAIDAQGDRVAADANGALAPIDRSLKRLNPAPRRAVAGSAKAQVAALTASRNALRARLSQAQAVSAAANTIFNLVAERRREGFSARVLEQSDSPFSPGFWTSLAAAVGPDLTRLIAVARDAAATAANAPEPRAAIGLGLGLALGLLLLFPVRHVLEGLGRRAMHGKRERRGFGRTAYAVWITAVDIGAPALAAIVLNLGAEWGGLLSDKAEQMAHAGVVAAIWGAAILALGRALATDLEASRRLLAFPDRTARRMGPLLVVVAVITAAGFLLTQLNYVAGASVASTIAANCVLSLAYAGIAGAILVSFSRNRATADSEAEFGETAHSPVWTLVSLILSAAIVVTVGAVLTGFTTLAALISNQIFWLSVLAASTFLMLRFVDEVCGALFGQRGWAARTLKVLFNFRRSTVAQTGILVSAALQLCILIGAVTLALTPFGQGGNLFLAHFSQLGQAIHIGSASISPAAIASGLGALAVGMGLVHLVRGWVVRRYLPATDWDAGVQNSVSTGVGYIGVGIALLSALAVMGLGFAQIALIVSALSVGIGFGLQQVVQNFVSGVILLVERPVKVGDWVNVDGVEGNIRRIRVRATEIETFDRSTVIVPNSDLITKKVQNKTLGDPHARIKLELSIGNPADAQRASEAILNVAAQMPQILKAPKPVVYIDALAAGAVDFVGYLFVASPRDVYKTRSALYFAILEAFAQAGIGLAGVVGATNVVVEPGPTMQGLLKRKGAASAVARSSS